MLDLKNECRPRIEDLYSELKATSLPGPFDFAFGLCRYSRQVFHNKTIIGRLVLEMKQNDSRRAAKIVADSLINFLSTHPLPYAPDMIITIPDSVTGRKFQANRFIGDRLGNAFSCPAEHDLLRTLGAIKPQKERPWAERLRDATPRYRLINSNYLWKKNILLYDDIYATGKSLTEVANLLRGENPKSITGLVLAQLTE